MTIATAAALVAAAVAISGCGATKASDAQAKEVDPGAQLLTPAERLALLPDAADTAFDIEAKRFDPTTAPVKPGPKTFDLSTTEVNVKVGDKVYPMWTFNDTVPGPVLRVVEGDLVTINIANAKDSKVPHSVDFHSSRLSLGGGYVQVAPGKSGTFRFKAEYPGVFMYHCGTPPILHHIGMGMYGMMIVQPKEGYGRTLPEYAFVQSELYRGIPDIERSAPAQMAFNGVPAQYLNDPIKVTPGQEIRLFVLNAGPSEVSSFHVVGTVMDTVHDDGNPRNLSYGRQTVTLGASGALVAEMKLVGEGKFPFVTHQFDHGAMGAVGLFLAGDGDPVGDGEDKMGSH